MDDQASLSATTKLGWRPTQLLAMSAVCLAVGFLAGYLLRGSAPGSPATSSTNVAAVPSPHSEYTGPMPSAQKMPKDAPSLSDLKRMADKKAEPLLTKLTSDPKNPELWNQVGLIYKSAHQFKEAAGYFEKSLQYDPKNVAVRETTGFITDPPKKRPRGRTA